MRGKNPRLVRHVLVLETMDDRGPSRGDLEMVCFNFADHFQEDIVTLKRPVEYPVDEDGDELDDFDIFEDWMKLVQVGEWKREEGIYAPKTPRQDWELRMRMIKALQEAISFLKKDWPQLPDKIDGYNVLGKDSPQEED